MLGWKEVQGWKEGRYEQSRGFSNGEHSVGQIKLIKVSIAKNKMPDCLVIRLGTR